MTSKTTDLRLGAKGSIFRVGNFALYSYRSCSETRAHFGLSRRELELIMLVASGFTKREIAKQMGVTPATADTFRRRAYLKLGVSSGAAAVAIVTTYLAGSQVEENACAPAY